MILGMEWYYWVLAGVGLVMMSLNDKNDLTSEKIKEE